MRENTTHAPWKSGFCTAEILNDLKAESGKRYARPKRLDATKQDSGERGGAE